MTLRSPGRGGRPPPEAVWITGAREVVGQDLAAEMPALDAPERARLAQSDAVPAPGRRRSGSGSLLATTSNHVLRIDRSPNAWSRTARNTSARTVIVREPIRVTASARPVPSRSERRSRGETRPTSGAGVSTQRTDQGRSRRPRTSSPIRAPFAQYQSGTAREIRLVGAAPDRGRRRGVAAAVGMEQRLDDAPLERDDLAARGVNGPARPGPSRALRRCGRPVHLAMRRVAQVEPVGGVPAQVGHRVRAGDDGLHVEHARIAGLARSVDGSTSARTAPST